MGCEGGVDRENDNAQTPALVIPPLLPPSPPNRSRRAVGVGPPLLPRHIRPPDFSPRVASPTPSLLLPFNPAQCNGIKAVY